MEYKIRKESETLMEKVFKKHAGRRGWIGRPEVHSLIKEIDPEFSPDPREFEDVVQAVDKDGLGTLNLEEFNRVVIHFLVKQAKHEHDAFIHKHEIGPNDFPEDAAPSDI